MRSSKWNRPLSSISIALLVLTGCGKHGDERGTPRALPTAVVRVETVADKRRVVTEEVVGTVRSKLRASLEAKISGRIERMLGTPGQSVKAGELLAQLDVREIQARLDQALAQRDQTERELKRFAALLQQKAVTQQEHDAVDTRQRMAGAAVREAETMLSYARVVAPFDGVITRKHADVGDLAAPGRALLELENPAALRFEADVPEAISDRIQPGAKLSVRAGSLTQEMEGTVSEVAPVADPNSRTFQVKLDLPAATGLRAGQFGRVAVPIGETTALRVPASAVRQRGQMEIVFVVTARQARLRLVKTGKRIGQEVEIVSGLSAGEQVVVEGAAGLIDGQPVELK